VSVVFRRSQPRFIEIDELITLHETAVDEFGGAHGIRERGLLESAMAMPRQSFGNEFAHQFPWGMAAAYAFHICKNHPFVDGNKRSALLALETFLRANNCVLTAEQDDSANAIIAVAENRLDKAGLTEWVTKHSRELPSLELREFFSRLEITQVYEIMQAAIRSPHDGEFQATVSEAARAIPMIRWLVESAAESSEGGDAGAADRLGAQATLLTALYRIAEDMGYEW